MVRVIKHMQASFHGLNCRGPAAISCSDSNGNELHRPKVLLHQAWTIGKADTARVEAQYFHEQVVHSRCFLRGPF